MSVLHGFTTFYAYVCYGKHLFRLLECAQKCMCFVSVRRVSRCAVITLNFMAHGWCWFLPSVPSTGSHYFSAVYLILSRISHRGFYYEEMFTPLNQILQKAMWRCYRRCLREASWDKEIIAPYGHLEALISSFPCGLVFWNFVFVEHSTASWLLLFVRFLWGFFPIHPNPV